MRIEQCRAGQAVRYQIRAGGEHSAESQVLFARILHVGLGQVYVRTEKGKRRWMQPIYLQPAPEGEHFLPQWEEDTGHQVSREQRRARPYQ